MQGGSRIDLQPTRSYILCFSTSFAPFQTKSFYPRGASNARVIAMIACVCLSVCVFVTRRYCIKTAKRRITQITPRDSPGNLVFWRGKFVGIWPFPFPWNLRSKWPTPFQTAQFRPIFAYSASTVRASEKSSISANGKSTTRFPTSHRWTVYAIPKSPKGGTKLDFAIFPVNFNFCRKKSAARFLRVKTSSSKVVATSFLYLTVHR